MDPLSGLLDHPRARGAFTLRVVMDPPWTVDVRDEAALTLVVVLRGGGRLLADGHATELLPGDVAVVRGPESYVVDHLAPEHLAAQDVMTSAVIGPDQTCTTPDGTDLHLAMAHGTRTWGNAADGADSLLVAAYQGASEVGRLATEALPRVAHVPAATTAGAGAGATAGAGAGATLVDLLAEEVVADGVGQGTVLDRLVDVLLVTTVRTWLAAHPDDAPGWLATPHDPVVQGALRAIHDRPAEPWTVVALAREVDVSRATFAARFRAQVGSPPMAYLTRWRLTLAADLLTTTDRTLASIAADVGYGSPFALSAAFSQQMGTSPSRYRRAHAQTG